MTSQHDATGESNPYRSPVPDRLNRSGAPRARRVLRSIWRGAKLGACVGVAMSIAAGAVLYLSTPTRMQSTSAARWEDWILTTVGLAVILGNLCGVLWGLGATIFLLLESASDIGDTNEHGRE